MTVLPSTIDEMTASSFGNDDTKPPQDREFEIPKDFVPPPPNREVGKLSYNHCVYCKLFIITYINLFYLVTQINVANNNISEVSPRKRISDRKGNIVRRYQDQRAHQIRIMSDPKKLICLISQESPRLYCFVLCYYVFNTKTRRFDYFIWPSLVFI